MANRIQMVDLNPNIFALSTADRELLDLLNSEVTQSERMKEEKQEEWEENWQNFRVEPYNHFRTENRQIAPYNWESSRGGIQSLKSPEPHQIVRTLTAVEMSSLYGVRNYIQAEPGGDEDVEAAKLVSRLVMYGLERPGGFRTDYETLQDANIFGMGVEKIGWKTSLRTVPRRMPIPDGNGGLLLDETGNPITVMVNVAIPVYDDIIRGSVSLWDLWLDTAVTRFDDQERIIERMRLSSDVLRSMKGQPGWIDSAIDEVLRLEPDEWIRETGDDTSPKLLTEQLTLDDIKHVKQFGYRGVWERTGMLPSDIARRNGFDENTSTIITIVNGIVVRKSQNPQYRGELSYCATETLPHGGFIYPLSPLSIIRYLVDIQDTQLILTTQAAIEAVYQNYLIGGGSGLDYTLKNALKNRKPRENFVVPGDISQIAPLPRDYTGLQIATQFMALLSQTMRQATAARDPIAGQLSGDRTTATESSIVAQSALQNVDLVTSLMERDNLPRKGRLVFDEYLSNLEDEGRFIRRVGDSESAKIRFMDVDGDYDIHFVGARHAQNRVSKANDFRAFVELILSNNFVAAQVDVMELVRRFADEALDVRGLESMVIQNPDEALARMQAMGLMRTGPAGVEQAAAPSPTQTPERSRATGQPRPESSAQRAGRASA